MPPKKKKNPLKFIIWLILLAAVLFFGAKFYLSFLESPVDSKAGIKAFVVNRGETLSSAVDRLQSEGYIRSSMYFKYLYQQKSDKIDAGDFKISSSMTTKEIVEALSSGSVDRWTTLLEGWRVEEIAVKLNKDLGVDKQQFINEGKKYEGYLFPDTYLFNPDASIPDLVSILRNTFNQKYPQDLQDKVKSKGLTPQQGVILASIVEREARSDEVRTKVAGILLKRFKMGMKLDADATVQYAKDSQSLKEGTLTKFWQPVTQQDYSKVISPYNTYLNNGFPPAPIANPSLSSLKAVANADTNTPYLYYYHDSKGNSYYAKTLDEHNENVANYH